MMPLRWLFLLLSCVLLSGCSAGYYWHLVDGHMTLMSQRVPVTDLLADPDIDQQLRDRLALSAEVLAFAELQLDLVADGSYRDYVALERNWVVWNLFAAPEFSLQPHQWCYPVAGCATYRGYFDQRRADRDAQALRAKGLDVYAAGAIAYSTLGWFDDPLTTPMLARSDSAIARLLVHELVHQRFYLKGDTRFNESLATAVAAFAADMWQSQGEQGAKPAPAPATDETALALVAELRDALETLYQRQQAPEVLRREKARLQDATRAAFADALARDPALQPWTGFFEGPLNNAQLNTVAAYHQWVPAFTALIGQCQADWACFWKRVQSLAEQPGPERDAQLGRLAAGDSHD